MREEGGTLTSSCSGLTTLPDMMNIGVLIYDSNSEFNGLLLQAHYAGKRTLMDASFYFNCNPRVNEPKMYESKECCFKSGPITTVRRKKVDRKRLKAWAVCQR